MPSSHESHQTQRYKHDPNWKLYVYYGENLKNIYAIELENGEIIKVDQVNKFDRTAKKGNDIYIFENGTWELSES